MRRSEEKRTGTRLRRSAGANEIVPRERLSRASADDRIRVVRQLRGRLNSAAFPNNSGGARLHRWTSRTRPGRGGAALRNLLQPTDRNIVVLTPESKGRGARTTVSRIVP